MNDAGKKQEWRVGAWWEQDLIVGIIMRNEMLQWQRAITVTTVMSDMYNFDLVAWRRLGIETLRLPQLISLTLASWNTIKYTFLSRTTVNKNIFYNTTGLF